MIPEKNQKKKEQKMNIDPRICQQIPDSHVPPHERNAKRCTTFPNMNSLDYRNLDIEHTITTKKQWPCYEIIESNEDKTLIFLASNEYVGRLWNGCLLGYARFDDVGMPHKEKLKLLIESNIKRISFLEKHMVLLATACGTVQLFSTRSDIRNENVHDLNLITKKTEHNGIIHAMDTVGKARAVTGSSDGCIKVWNVEEYDLVSEKTYENAHSAAIRSISSQPNSDAMFASCGADRRLQIWDLRSNKPVVAHCHNPLHGNSVCLWHNAELLYMGDISGNLHTYDARKLNAALASQQLFNRQILKIQANPEKNLLGVVAQWPMVKVLKNDEGDLKRVSEEKAKDYIRDVAWSGGNERNEEAFFSVGYNKSVNEHVIKIEQ